MNDRHGNTMRAGGSILAGSILVGTIAGVFLRQSSIGFLAGLAFGLAVVALIWLRDRR